VDVAVDAALVEEQEDEVVPAVVDVVPVVDPFRVVAEVVVVAAALEGAFSPWLKQYSFESV
jgi:hypothetical protein